MFCTTPKRSCESSDKYLLRKVQMCTEQSFEQTPMRHKKSRRKTAQMLSSTLTSGITLLSIGNQTLVGENTIVDDSILSLDRTLTETIVNKKSFINTTTVASPWEVLSSIHNETSDFSILTVNQSNVSQATVISRRSSKGTSGPTSFITRVFKRARTKPVTPRAKFMNRCVRDIDRLNDTFGQEWITLPNFV